MKVCRRKLARGVKSGPYWTWTRSSRASAGMSAPSMVPVYIGCSGVVDRRRSPASSVTWKRRPSRPSRSASHCALRTTWAGRSPASRGTTQVQEPQAPPAEAVSSKPTCGGTRTMRGSRLGMGRSCRMTLLTRPSSTVTEAAAPWVPSWAAMRREVPTGAAGPAEGAEVDGRVGVGPQQVVDDGAVDLAGGAVGRGARQAARQQRGQRQRQQGRLDHHVKTPGAKDKPCRYGLETWSAGGGRNLPDP